MQADTATAAPAPKKGMGRRPRTGPRTFTPLALETRTHIPTADAAHHLSLSEQTLRAWACFENGHLRPLRIPGRLGLLWRTDEIRRLLGVEGEQ
jgi:hypothetical protein